MLGLLWSLTQSSSALKACYLAGTCVQSHFDSLRGQPYFDLDTRLTKNIKIKERSNLKLIFQAFDVTNRANYGNNFGDSIADPKTFGHPTGFFNPNATYIPRALWSEFGIHFTF